MKSRSKAALATSSANAVVTSRNVFRYKFYLAPAIRVLVARGLIAEQSPNVPHQMEALAKRIEQDLKGRRFCVVFENELERCFPQTARISRGVREQQIRTFAESHDWIVTIAHTRAIFARKDAPFLA